MAPEVLDRPAPTKQARQREFSPPSREKLGAGQKKGSSNRLVLLVSSPLLDKASGRVFPTISSRTELDAIASAIAPLEIQFEFAVHHVIADRPYVGKEPAHFLHIAAHGFLAEAGAVLAAELSDGRRKLIDEREFASVLAKVGRPPCSVAVLNVCHSQGLAEALLRLGVAHVVAIDAEEAVLAETGRLFSRYFYYSLLTGSTVRKAFDLGREAVRGGMEEIYKGRAFDEFFKIRLLPEDVPHSESIAVELIKGTTRLPVWEKTNLDERARYPFSGRQHDLVELNQEMKKGDGPTLFVVWGMGGMGKTAFADAVARRQHERVWWHDGVYRIDARDFSAASEIRPRLAAAIGLEESTAESDGA